MPVPPPAREAKLVNMYGFSMTQYRLVHNLSQVEYEALSVPVYAPSTGKVSADDAAIDNAARPQDSNL